MWIVFVSAVLAAGASHCVQASGYTSSYKVHSEVVTWQQARKLCLAEGAHLAVPRSTSEARYIGRLIEAFEDRLGKKPKIYSIGLYKKPGNTEWRTIFGKTMSGIKWGKGHPLTSYDGTLYASLCRHGEIKTYKGNRKQKFICKKN